MIILECPWELKNIGKRTVEVSISVDDVFVPQVFEELTLKYEYVVVKVPMNMIDCNIGLTLLGFNMIETQINVLKNVTNKTGGNSIEKHVSFEELILNDSINRVIHNITPNMFSTDRVTLDKAFSPEIGMQRYVNWMCSEFEEKRSKVAIVKYDSNEVGFMLFRIAEQTFHLLLNGLYKPWQGRRLGIITPYSPEIYVRKNRLDVKRIETSISSNNIPVVKLYSRLGFEVSSMTYVYVKHCS
jgi:hypothetical protein